VLHGKLSNLRTLIIFQSFFILNTSCNTFNKKQQIAQCYTSSSNFTWIGVGSPYYFPAYFCYKIPLSSLLPLYYCHSFIIISLNSAKRLNQLNTLEDDPNEVAFNNVVDSRKSWKNWSLSKIECPFLANVWRGVIAFTSEIESLKYNNNHNYH
jgi:hypothetical protein